VTGGAKEAYMEKQEMRGARKKKKRKKLMNN
jgi:hypothetical protein